VRAFGHANMQAELEHSVANLGETAFQIGRSILLKVRFNQSSCS
jgi:hypothetical protein